MAIPGKDKHWSGVHKGNYAGNLWASYNIDLEQNPGRMALADKFIKLSSSTGLGLISKFIRTNASGTDEWWGMVSGSKLLNNGNVTITSNTWAADDTTGFAGVNTPLDMVVHESANGEERLFVAMDDDIAVLNTTATVNTWDVNWGSTIPSVPIPVVSPVLTHRPMAKLQRLLAVANKVSNVPKIDTIDKDDVVTLGALTFDADYTMRVAMSNSNRFWFGLQHDFDGHLKIIEWDGFSQAYNKEYELEGSFPLTGFIVNDVPYYITERGIIYRYTGGGFLPVQDFNFQDQREQLSPNLTNENTIRPHGVAVRGHLVYINIGVPVVESTVGADTMVRGVRRTRSGVWIYNTVNNNLYHYMAYGEHATSGTDVNYGCGYVDNPGTVIITQSGDSRAVVATGSVFTGGAAWLTTTEHSIYRNVRADDFRSDAGRNRGYFITPYMPMEDAEAMWEALWVKFRKFRITEGDTTSDDRIVVKWRVEDPLFEADAQDPNGGENPLFNANGTWVNTTSFTCKVPIGVSAGDEVEILTGDNAGCSFNISTLSGTPDNTSSLTVTIDEAAPTSSTDKFLCRFDNWNTETPISETSIDNKRVPFTSIGHGQFIQLKIELRGHGTELDEIIPVLKSKTKINQA